LLEGQISWNLPSLLLYVRYIYHTWWHLRAWLHGEQSLAVMNSWYGIASDFWILCGFSFDTILRRPERQKDIYRPAVY
jgi:hypothetical protein